MTLKRRDFLRIGAGAALIAPSAFWAARSAAAQPGKKRKILYFTRCQGFVHGPVGRPNANPKELASSEKWMQTMGDRYGFEVVCTKEGNVFDGDIDQYDAFVFYTSGDLTKPITNTAKEPPSSPMTEQGKSRLLKAIEDGKGFLGIHSATDSFRTPKGQVDPYIAMLGGEFLSHGKQQEATMHFVSPKFPGLEGMKDFRLFEEWYSLVKIAKDLHVILVQETKGMEGWQYDRPPFPATWARANGKGRVFYTSMGHSDPIFANPTFEKVFIAGLRWVDGDTSFDPVPNVAEVCPGADQWPVQPAGTEKPKAAGKKVKGGEKKKAKKK
jgi:hypothetical protein